MTTEVKILDWEWLATEAASMRTHRLERYIIECRNTIAGLRRMRARTGLDQARQAALTNWERSLETAENELADRDEREDHNLHREY